MKTVATKEGSRKGIVAGIGFCLTPDDSFAGIDLDNCIFPDSTLEPWEHKIATTLQSYTEISPNGTGVHIFVRGTLPSGARRKGNIELYDQARFLTVTGHVLEGFLTTVEARQAELEQVHSMLQSPPAPPPPPPPHIVDNAQSAPAYLDVDDLL